MRVYSVQSRGKSNSESKSTEKEIWKSLEGAEAFASTFIKRPKTRKITINDEIFWERKAK